MVCPIHLRKSYDCIEIKLNDPYYCQECIVTIDGEYSLNALSSDVFQGMCFVSNYPDTNQECRFVISMSQRAPLYYKENQGKEVNSREYCIGRIFSKRFFQHFVICVFSKNHNRDTSWWDADGDFGSWNTIDGYCIVSGCDSYESALTALKKYKVISE